MSQDRQIEALRQIAVASKLLRTGIANALPVAGDQYLTITVPGTVIDTRDIEDGGSYVWDPKKLNDASTPLAVQQAEAALVDGMMPISQVMIGNTGKSVYRSYSRALDCLVAIEAPGAPGKPSQATPEYDAAMKYLQEKDESKKCPIDYYVEKQAAWSEAQSEWDQAKLDEMTQLTKDITDLAQRQQAMNKWNQVHFRKFKSNVQAKWMDWVVNGYKYGVENAFGTVDIESIMARIESSKESLRDSMIVDADGTNELAAVTLMPKDWALQCQKKANDWENTNGKFSLEQLDSEIARLGRLQLSYDALTAAVNDGAYPVKGTPAVPSNAPDLQGAFKTLYEAQGELNEAQSADANASTEDTQKAIATATTKVQTAQDALQTALKAWEDNAQLKTKENLQTLSGNKTDALAWIKSQSEAVATSIATLTKLRATKALQTTTIPTIVSAEAARKNPSDPTSEIDPGACATDLAPSDAASANPMFTSTDDTAEADPWTDILVSYSASSFSQTKDESSWGMSVSGGLNFGLFSLGGAYSHEESKQDMYSAMAKCDVTISFQAMAVNIQRPWLYGELFNDAELDVADNVKLSPGPAKLQDWLTKVSDPAVMTQIADHSQFPAYPTSFVLAANTVIEFSGQTSKIETHFSQHSNSGSMSVGYGPFAMHGSFHEAASHSNVQIEVTATGCKIKFGSPQIIGWVSQILPELKRPAGYNPMVTGFV